MAATYTVVTTYPGLDTAGGTQTTDVVFVGITTKPHGTYVEFAIPQKGYAADLVAGAAVGWADIAETLWSLPYVVGVQWSQQVNPSNLLEVAWIITVSSTSGLSSGQITIANNDLGPGLGKTRIANLNEQLDETEAL